MLNKAVKTGKCLEFARASASPLQVDTGMSGRIARRAAAAAMAAADAERRAREAAHCALCARPLGTRVEWHHPVPRSEGGRETVPLHPICHRTIHASCTNRELARMGSVAALRDHAGIAAFLRWIADKPPDFNAPTCRARSRD